MKAMRAVGEGALVLAALALLAAGCSRVRQAADRAKRGNDLRALGLMYHNYVDSNNKGPASAEDLKKVANSPEEQALVQAVKDGKYVLIWGTTIREMQNNPEGSSGTVLGYEAAAPSAGGMVLMGDGVVRNMTAAELAAAPKAKPTSR
jgi:TPR repeat protein